MRQSKQLFFIAALCLAAVMSGCNSDNLGPSPYAVPSNLSYSQPNVVYVKDSTIVGNVPIVIGTVIRYSISPDLPNGLRFDDSSGIISGRPYFIFPATQYRVIATNSGGSDTVFITIAVALTPYYLAYASPQAYAAGVAVNIVPISLGSLNQFSISPALPTGLSLNTNNGIINGTPNGVSPAKVYTVKGVNGKDSVKASLTISVYNAPPSNLSYSFDTLNFTGGIHVDVGPQAVTGTVTHYSVSPGLPAGLSLNDTTGRIFGTPTAITPAANYTITASNGVGATTTVLNVGVTEMNRNSGANNTLNSIVWTGSSIIPGTGQLVAVGDEGEIVSSPDGIAWSIQSSGTTHSLNSLVWNGSQLVAVGSGGTILTSVDGSIWTARVSGTKSILKAVIWAANQFVAVGNNGAIVSSSDGITWIVRPSGVTSALNAVAWNGSLLVAVNDTGALTSSNGVAWVGDTSQIMSGSITLAAGGNRFLAGGCCGHPLTSTDGLLWTRMPDSEGLVYLNFVTWVDNQFLGLGYSYPDYPASGYYNNQKGPLFTSANGSVWQVQNFGWLSRAVTSIGNKYVMVGDGGRILTSY